MRKLSFRYHRYLRQDRNAGKAINIIIDDLVPFPGSGFAPVVKSRAESGRLSITYKYNKST